MADIFNSLNIDGSNSSNSLIYANELIGGTASTDQFVGEISGDNSSELITKRISSIVKYHLPEFIRSDYSVFVYFLESYYKFLEQDFSAQEIVQDIKNYSDIDKTAPAFLYYFLQNYAKDIPLDVQANKRLLIKRINDLYTSKGSSISFDILFRILYNTVVELKYPYEFVLKPSDGTWNQKTAIGVRVITGNRNDIVNRNLTYTTVDGARFETPVLSTKLLISGDVEISLDYNKLASSYTSGDFVYVYNVLGEEIFKGQILKTLVNYSIQQGGTGFKIGQIFNINFASNTGTLVKVTKVSSTGGIEKLKIINFGYNYPNNLVVNLNKDSTRTSIKDAATSSTRGSTDSIVIATAVTTLGNIMLKGNVTTSTSINRVDGFGGTEFTSNLKAGDYVTIVSNVYTVQNVVSNTQFYITTVGLTNSSNVKGFATDTSVIYFASDYVEPSSAYTASFITINDSDYRDELPSSAVPVDFASITFTSGALARYPGTYTTNKGFISENDIRLEDDLLYQPFAYQTNTQIDISKFYDSVIKLVHPAGQRLFNNRTINNSIDVSANVASLSFKIDEINFESYSSAKSSDIPSLSYVKAPIGGVDELDAANAIDDVSITSNLAAINDLLEDISDNITNNFATIISDSVDNTDNNAFNLNIQVSDGTEDFPISNAVYTINTTIDDTADSIDDGTLELNPYTSEIYFAETYTSGITTF